MSHVAKHLELVKVLSEKTDIIERAGRISIEQKFPPFYRTFVLIGRTMDRDTLNNIDDLAAAHGMNCNPFRSGADVTSITFTDVAEVQRS